jgi:hypothetical protein
MIGCAAWFVRRRGARTDISMGDHRSGEVIADNPEVAFTDGTYFYITVFNGQLPGAPVPLLAPRTYYVNASTGSTPTRA